MTREDGPVSLGASGDRGRRGQGEIAMEQADTGSGGYQRKGPKPGTKAARIIGFLRQNTERRVDETGVTAAEVLARLFKRDPVYSKGDKDRARRSVRAMMTALAHEGFIRKVSAGRFARLAGEP